MPKTVAVQTSPNRFSSPTKFCRSLVHDIRPEHFTVVQTSKLEDAFRQRTKPDTVTMQVLAMESNLLFRDVEAWFKERRLKWVADADKLGVNSILESRSDSSIPDGSLPDVQC